MPTGPRFLLPHACYHIITRGNQRQPVFLDEKDYGAYMDRLKRYKKRYGFLLYGFCLMPNHVHLIGQPKETDKLAKFMHGLSRSYTAYFNKRYEKVGHLWQGRYISKVITKGGYLIDCIQYIEYNPLRANLANVAPEYRWSSYKERVAGDGNTDRILNELRL